MFSLVAVPEEIAGGKKVYRAYVKTNGTVDKEALAKALAEKTGQDISLANYFLDALYEFAAEIYVRLDGIPFGDDDYVKFRVTVTNELGSAVHEGDLT